MSWSQLALCHLKCLLVCLPCSCVQLAALEALGFVEQGVKWLARSWCNRGRRASLQSVGRSGLRHWGLRSWHWGLRRRCLWLRGSTCCRGAGQGGCRGTLRNWLGEECLQPLGQDGNLLHLGLCLGLADVSLRARNAGSRVSLLCHFGLPRCVRRVVCRAGALVLQELPGLTQHHQRRSGAAEAVAQRQVLADCAKVHSHCRTVALDSRIKLARVDVAQK
mmetsp:Transcript_101121/g.294433  ORF Transcript_101121/g.294433 Transcript_101121/m.294433 type:complete len:220 (-) Transcript_101121:712-1371(-)